MMELDFNLIGNFIVAIFFYNIILKSLLGMFVKWIFSSDEAKEVKKTFKEKLAEKLK